MSQKIRCFHFLVPKSESFKSVTVLDDSDHGSDSESRVYPSHDAAASASDSESAGTGLGRAGGGRRAGPGAGAGAGRARRAGPDPVEQP